MTFMFVSSILIALGFDGKHRVRVDIKKETSMKLKGGWSPEVGVISLIGGLLPHRRCEITEMGVVF